MGARQLYSVAPGHSKVLRPLPAHKGKTDEPHLPAFARGWKLPYRRLGPKLRASVRCLASPLTKSRPPLPRCLRPGGGLSDAFLGAGGKASLRQVLSLEPGLGKVGAVREKHCQKLPAAAVRHPSRASQRQRRRASCDTGSEVQPSADRCEVRLLLRPSRGSRRLPRRRGSTVGTVASKSTFVAKAREASQASQASKPSNSQCFGIRLSVCPAFFASRSTAGSSDFEQSPLSGLRPRRPWLF